MKNGKLVTAHLDECEKIDTIKARGGDYIAHMSPESPFGQTWFAARAGGWTVAEMDAAHMRRFGKNPPRPTS